MCQELLAASDEQQRLVDALLTLATSERGLEHHEPIDLSILADTVLLAPWPEADQLEIAITAMIDPAPTTGHAALAERLIANLIDNAIHHNTPGGHVEITTGVRHQHAFVTVTNSGPMIPVDEIQRLFQPFQRLGGARTQHTNGHGLGLSIVQAIATAHDATITPHAQPDGGLAIEVSFPRSEKPRERLGAQMPAPA